MEAFQEFAGKGFGLRDFVGEFETGAEDGDVGWMAVVAWVDGGLLGGVCGMMLGVGRSKARKKQGISSTYRHR
jgi:hypothetical protein